jgi:hypothetical protein
METAVTDDLNRRADERAEAALRASFADDRGWSSEHIDPAAVRTRVRRRNRLRVVGAAAAVMVIAAGVATGVELGSREGNASTGPTSTSGPHPAPSEGWRWDFYRDIRVKVPADWAYGTEPSSDWCVDGGKWLPKQPYVDLEQDHAVRSLGCASTNGEPGLSDEPPTRLWAPHVTLAALDPKAEASVRQVDGWWVVERPVGHVLVRAVGQDRDLLDGILDSATVVDGDGSCAPHSPVQDSAFPRPTPAFDVAGVSDVDAITVCQYDLSGAVPPGLVAQYELAGADADRELNAIQRAPLGGGPDRPENCVPDDVGGSAIVLHLHTAATDSTVRTMYVYYSTCHGNGFDDGTALRELTANACMPLFHEPVSLTSGSSEPFERCYSAPND